MEINEGEGADLLTWLVADPDVARTTEITSAPSEREGEMGSGFDLLNFLVSNSISLSSLIVAIVTFRESRRRSTGAAPAVKIIYQTIVVSVEGDGQEALRRLTQALGEAEMADK